jgi:hypothetical protein
MVELNESWLPGFGEIVTWFAMDRHGRIAVMVNNCFGVLPKALLRTIDIEKGLDQLSEYMWGESDEFLSVPENKMGKTKLDCYSAIVYRDAVSRHEVEQLVLEGSVSDLKVIEYSLPSVRGYFVYHAVEGAEEGQDYPVGYEGSSKNGDYFRYLVPAVYAGVEDFPLALRRFIVFSDKVDFEEDRLFESERVDELFVEMYSAK